MTQTIPSENAKPHIGWLDTLKGICAIMVVLIHTQKPEVYAFLFRPFFLMCFFFASGYTIRTRKGYILKQFTYTLKVVTGAIILYVVFHWLVNDTFVGTQRIIGAYLQSHFAYPNYAPIIWFIPCICIAKCLFQIILRITNENGAVITILSLLLTAVGYYLCSIRKIFLPWHIQIACLVQLFFLMGYSYRRYQTSIFHKVPTLMLCISFIIYFLLILGGPLAGDLALMKVSDWPRYMICATVGTIMMVLLSQKVDNRVLQYVGRHSLLMFVLQDYIRGIIYKFINSVGAANEPKTVTSLLVTVLVVVSICSIAYIKDYCIASIKNEKITEHA